MYGLSSYYRVLSVCIVLLSISLLVAACSHRTIHGTSQVQKSKKMDKSLGEDGRLSTLDELATEVGSDLPIVGKDTGGGGRFSPTDGVLSQETLDEIGSGIKSLSSADLAEQYWQQRNEAELQTNQSGLEDVFFELDSWELTSQAKRSLAANAEFLRSNPTNEVTIEGHCDERGTRAYNYVLGEKRALRVRNYLASLGVSPNQLTIMSYGKDNPLCRGNSEMCFQQNRRAHFLLGMKMADSRLWEEDVGRTEE